MYLTIFLCVETPNTKLNFTLEAYIDVKIIQGELLSYSQS